MKKYLFLFLLLIFAKPATATLPAGVSLNGGRHCNSFLQVSTSSGTISCSLNNVVAGDVILAGFSIIAATAYTVTGTETPTCPSQLHISKSFGGGFVHNHDLCYLTLSSSHASFQFTVTLTAGGATNNVALEVWEFAGLGAVDTGSRNAVNNTTTSFTTAANNEFAFSWVSDQTTQISSAGSNKPWGRLNASAVGVDYRWIDLIQNTGTAGSYTASFTETGPTGGNGLAFIDVVAFAITGGAPEGTLHPNQQSQGFLNGNTGASGTLRILFEGTLNGSKGVLGYYLQDNAAATCSVDSGETCVCPASSQVHHLYSGTNYAMGTCYVDFTSAHSGVVTFSIAATGAGLQRFYWVSGYEMVGLVSGIDASSEASAAATTVSYTTTAANEWTFGAATDGAATYPPNLMVPGNSFSNSVGSWTDINNSVFAEAFSVDKTTVSSGSNTFSYTMTSSAFPMIATMSFTPTAPPATGFPMVF